jgi:hypothetical protein
MAERECEGLVAAITGGASGMTCSVASYAGLPKRAPYSATKGALPS